MVCHFNKTSLYARLLVLQLLVHRATDSPRLLATAVIDGVYFADVLAVGGRLLKVLVRLVVANLMFKKSSVLVNHLA